MHLEHFDLISWACSYFRPGTRQFIPKGTDFDTVSDDDLAKYVDLINNRPRKRLNWLSPNQVFDMELNSVALGTGI